MDIVLHQHDTEQLLQQYATTNTMVQIEALDGATETPWT
jgi:hypothetical protein